MAQHDYSIANQTAASLRTDLNNVLSAIVSNNSGSTEPPDTFANMFWYDTTANILKMRNEADDAWISLGYLDQTADAFRLFDDTQVVNTSGTQTGLLGDQATATWETGTGTTESLVSPAKVKAAIDANVTTTLVNTAIASSSVGAVGTYAFLGDNGTVVAYGGTTAGSNLDYRGVTDNPNDTNTGQVPNNNISPAGTWRAMGILQPYNSEGYQSATLFLRIA
jgi:hypothetical protein